MNGDSEFPADFLVYADSSALFKLVKQEDASEAVRELAANHQLASSTLSRIELLRTARREDFENSIAAPGAHIARALSVIETTDMNSVGDDEVEVASDLPHPRLKSLDAIHIATALLLEADVFVTYDQRQAEAAKRVGLKVVSPA